jgi:hypothetical protein
VNLILSVFVLTTSTSYETEVQICCIFKNDVIVVVCIGRVRLCL